jgi:hypothetical protein
LQPDGLRQLLRECLQELLCIVHLLTSGSALSIVEEEAWAATAHERLLCFGGAGDVAFSSGSH